MALSVLLLLQGAHTADCRSLEVLICCNGTWDPGCRRPPEPDGAVCACAAGGPQSLMGLTIATAACCEVPLFFFCGHLIRLLVGLCALIKLQLG